jgi:dephospho-CoA kinase
VPQPYKVGLTGGIGSGKSEVSKLFSRLGVIVIDADDISHEITSTNDNVKTEISKVFGSNVIDSSGNLNRKMLRDIIFMDIDSRKKLESILHPQVYLEIKRKLKDITSAYCILSIPLLLETGATDMVDSILVVDCPVTIQLERASRRDGISKNNVSKTISAQISREDRLKAANDVIINDGDFDKLFQQVEALHLDYLNKELPHI